MFNIIKLQAENKRLKEEIAQKEITIQYLNACINKANRRTVEIQRQLELVTNVLIKKTEQEIDFPNSSLYKQISINDILEN